MTILDLLTLLSYIALNVDILFQIKRIYETKSSRDLSIVGMGIRYAAILIILIKFMRISDVPLIIGQGLIVLTFTTYLLLALYYRHAHARASMTCTIAPAPLTAIDSYVERLFGCVECHRWTWRARANGKSNLKRKAGAAASTSKEHASLTKGDC